MNNRNRTREELQREGHPIVEWSKHVLRVSQVLLESRVWAAAVCLIARLHVAGSSRILRRASDLRNAVRKADRAADFDMSQQFPGLVSGQSVGLDFARRHTPGDARVI